MNRASDGSIPKPNEGAPPVSTALPSFFRILVFESSATMPAAAATSGSALTLASKVSGIDGVEAVSPSTLMSAALPDTTASVFA